LIDRHRCICLDAASAVSDAASAEDAIAESDCTYRPSTTQAMRAKKRPLWALTMSIGNALVR
jgi:hypothetical protein